MFFVVPPCSKDGLQLAQFDKFDTPHPAMASIVGPQEEMQKIAPGPMISENCDLSYVVVSSIFYFHPYLGKIPIWRIFFKGVETTN